jgi:hypothetical protein
VSELTVYVIDTDHGVKVGITKLGIESRLSDLQRGSGLLNATVVRTWLVRGEGWTGGRAIERGAHWILRESRTIGEWFHCHPLEACDAVDRCIRKGVPPEALFGAEDAAVVRRYRAKVAA